MGLKSLFGKLLGSTDDAGTAGESVDYKDYRITPQPKPQGGQFYTAGRAPALSIHELSGG